MSTKRMLQLGEEIRNFIATMLLRGGVRDPRVKNVTIHSVKMTSDLQIAKVYFATSENIKETQTGLNKAAGFIRKELGKELQIRYIPQIIFYYDDSLEYSLKMSAVLSKVREELKESEASVEIPQEKTET